MSNLARLLIVAIGFSLVAGCGKGDGTATVSGMVSISGEAMGKGVVNFFSEGGDRPLGAPVSAEGTYTAVLPPGDYKVVVMTSSSVPDGWKEGDPLPQPKVAVPLKYTQPRSTPLRVTVGADDLAHDFALE